MMLCESEIAMDQCAQLEHIWQKGLLEARFSCALWFLSFCCWLNLSSNQFQFVCKGTTSNDLIDSVLVQILLLSCKDDQLRGKYKKINTKFEGRHVFRGQKLSLWFINGSWMLGPERCEGTVSGIAFCKDDSYSPEEISNELNWSYLQCGE